MKQYNFIKIISILIVTFIAVSFVEVEYKVGYGKDLLMSFYIPDELPLKSTLPVKDRILATDLGRALFAKRTGITKVSCADCHSFENSFYSDSPLPTGSGLFKTFYNQLHLKIYNEPSNIPLDNPSLKSPTAVNSALRENMLWGGELGFNGFNEDVTKEKLLAFNGGNTDEGLEAQVAAAHVGHLMEGLVMESRHDNLLQEVSKKAFDKPIDFQVIQCAISIFEQSLLTNNNRVNRVIRGLDKKLHSEKGMELYKTHCYDCHNTDTLVYKIGISEFEGRMRMTKDSSDYGLIYVPRLENIKDAKGMFHNDERISFWKAVNGHRGVINKTTGETLNYTSKLSRKEKGAIKTFVFKDLYDNDVLN